MTENEAIKEFKERIKLIEKCYRGEVDYKEALEVGVQALEKQIPKKVKRFKKASIYFCPVCRTIYQHSLYCSGCGQRLNRRKNHGTSK